MTRRVIVVGGGLSGLATAWHLQRAGEDVTVLEAAPEPGGLVKSAREGDWLVEWAANGILDNAPDTLALVEALELGDALVKARGASAERYIVHRDRLVRLPAKPQQIITSSLLTPQAKLRLLRESKLPPAPLDAPEESIGQFVRRRFGPDAMPAVDAFVTGVYAGDPERLSLPHAFPNLQVMERSHGSVLTALRSGKRGRPRPRLFAFKDGMGMLTDALAAALGDAIKTGVRVTRVTPRADGGFAVACEGAPDADADAVVVATGPNTARDVVPDATWDAVPTAPVAVVALGYRAAEAPGATGFGYLAPESARRFALGAVFESNLFPHRAPPGHVLVRALVGGRRHPDRARLEEDALVARVREDLDGLRVTVENPEPAFVHVARPGAIPQIEVGHGKRLEAMEALEAAHTGLFFTGAGWRTVSVNGLLEGARAIAERVSDERPSG